MKRHPNTCTRAYYKPVYNKHRPPEKKKMKKGSNNEKSFHGFDSNEAFYDFAYGSKFTRTKSPPGAFTGHPYHAWSVSLATIFDLQLYNDFRRLALDELFTQHVKHGFTALLNFYQIRLLSEDPLPDEVIADIVHLSRSLPFNLNVILLDLLQTVMGSGGMEQRNRIKAGNFFNRGYSQPLEALGS